CWFIPIPQRRGSRCRPSSRRTARRSNRNRFSGKAHGSASRRRKRVRRLRAACDFPREAIASSCGGGIVAGEAFSVARSTALEDLPEERELQPVSTPAGLKLPMKTLFVTGVMTLISSYAFAQAPDSMPGSPASTAEVEGSLTTPTGHEVTAGIASYNYRE